MACDWLAKHRVFHTEHVLSNDSIACSCVLSTPQPSISTGSIARSAWPAHTSSLRHHPQSHHLLSSTHPSPPDSVSVSRTDYCLIHHTNIINRSLPPRRPANTVSLARKYSSSTILCRVRISSIRTVLHQCQQAPSMEAAAIANEMH